MSLLTLDQLLSPPPPRLPSFRRREEDEEDTDVGESLAAAPSPALGQRSSRRQKTTYLSEKPRPLDFYKEEDQNQNQNRTLMIDSSSAAADVIPPALAPPMMPGESSGEDHEVKAPKKRAETWVQDETRSLIGFRREMDGLFNTSKSNKHLWEQISMKMREKGFDRSPTMCTDKWRNLLKEFKKARHLDKGGGGSGKMSYYKELDELLKERNKGGGVAASVAAAYKSSTPPSAAKVDSYLQFSDKGLEDAGITFGSVEANGRSTLNLERRVDHEGHPLAITAADAVPANGVPPWNWRDATANDEDNHVSYTGRVISVKWGDYTRRIGIDGTSDAIKEAIKSAFGLRTRRAFWLEDEDEVVRSLDRDMPLGTYTLHLDEGLTIKVCLYDETERIPLHTEEKTLYTEEDFRDFLSRRGWTGLRELSGFGNIDCLDELRPGALYQGVRLLGD